MLLQWHRNVDCVTLGCWVLWQSTWNPSAEVPPMVWWLPVWHHGMHGFSKRLVCPLSLLTPFNLFIEEAKALAFKRGLLLLPIFINSFRNSNDFPFLCVEAACRSTRKTKQKKSHLSGIVIYFKVRGDRYFLQQGFEYQATETNLV